jgi:hypothetical protein
VPILAGKISSKREEASKVVGAVDIMLDNIKREVIEPAKASNRKNEKSTKF